MFRAREGVENEGTGSMTLNKGLETLDLFKGSLVIHLVYVFCIKYNYS